MAKFREVTDATAKTLIVQIEYDTVGSIEDDVAQQAIMDRLREFEGSFEIPEHMRYGANQKKGGAFVVRVSRI